MEYGEKQKNKIKGTRKLNRPEKNSENKDGKQLKRRYTERKTRWKDSWSSTIAAYVEWKRLLSITLK